MDNQQVAFVGTFGPPRVPFDGHTFSGWDFHATPWLYWMAWHARRGDIGAAEALNAAGIVLTDLDGRAYWPVEAEGKP